MLIIMKKIGISQQALSLRSISKQRGAEISSKLITTETAA